MVLNLVNVVINKSYHSETTQTFTPYAFSDNTWVMSTENQTLAGSIQTSFGAKLPDVNVD